MCGDRRAVLPTERRPPGARLSGVASAGTTASLPRVLPPTEAPGPPSGCHGRVRAPPPPSAAAARPRARARRGELGRLLLAGPRLVLRELGARGDELGRLLLRLVLAVAVGQAQIRQRALLGERSRLARDRSRRLVRHGGRGAASPLLLLLERLPGRLLRVEPARRPRLRTAPLEREHGPVIQVRQRRDGGDHALAVLGQLRHHRVALHVQAGELRHGSEQTHHRLWVAVDLVILQVHGGQAAHARSSSRLSSVLSLQLLACKVCSSTSARGAQMRHVVVGDVQRAERDGQRRRDARDHVLLREQNTCSSTHALRPSRSSNPLPSRNSDLSPVYASRFWIRSKLGSASTACRSVRASRIRRSPCSASLATWRSSRAPSRLSPDGTHDTRRARDARQCCARVRRKRSP